MGGTLVPGEAGEDYVDPNRVVVAGRNDPTDFLSLFDIDTASTGLSTDRANQRVEVEAPRSREDIALDYFFYPNDEGVAGGPAGQKVDVLGNRIADQAVDVIDLFDRDTGTQKVTVPGTRVTETAPTDITNQQVVLPGKKVEPWSGEPFDLVGMPADVASQKVGVTSTKLPPEVTTPAATPAPASRPTLSVNLPTKQNLAMPTARQQDMSYITDSPLYRSVFYERMQQAERQKELARALQEQENADPYERLMALADQNPGMAVDELMKIVEGT
jgi:hypothetical protein